MAEESNPLPGTVDEALHQTLSDIRAGGLTMESAPRSPRELLAYQTGMTDPLARISENPSRPLTIVPAVARFVWMVAGNDRLEDIAYYEPAVRRFTDDGLLVPGSSYGRRLFAPRPGVDQVAGVVERLRKDAYSRRAAAVIWSPEDAVRPSADIPCAFGMFFHIRDGALVSTVAMRSNNAVILLPFNFFEFSLVAEMVAVEVGVPFGEYVHWAASMHYYDPDGAKVDQITSAPPAVSTRMPAMPTSDALASAKKIAVFEARARHASSAAEVMSIRGEARAELHSYWADIFDVLAVHCLEVRGAAAEADVVAGNLPDCFAPGVGRHLGFIRAKAEPPTTGEEQLSIDLGPEVDLKPGATPAERVAAAMAASGGSAEFIVEIGVAALRYTAETGEQLTDDEFRAVAALLTRDDYGLAARSQEGASADAGRLDRSRVTSADVQAALTSIRER
jgi:hypothetical protein